MRIALGAKAARDRVKCLRADFVTLACGAAFAQRSSSSSRNGSTAAGTSTAAAAAAASAAATTTTSTNANSSRSASPLTALASPSSTSSTSGQFQGGTDGGSELLLLNGVTGRGVTGYVVQPL